MSAFSTALSGFAYMAGPVDDTDPVLDAAWELCRARCAKHGERPCFTLAQPAGAMPCRECLDGARASLTATSPP